MYSTFDVMRMLEIKRGRFKNWIEEGFIVPCKQDVFPSGLKRSYFTISGVYLVELFCTLISVGLSRHFAGHVVSACSDKIHHLDGSNMPKYIVIEVGVLDNTTISFTDDLNNIHNMVKKRFCHIINFKMIVTVVDLMAADSPFPPCQVK